MSWSMRVKIAVLAPMPRASDSTTTALNTGAFDRLRRAKRTSDERFMGLPKFHLRGLGGESALFFGVARIEWWTVTNGRGRNHRVFQTKVERMALAEDALK